MFSSVENKQSQEIKNNEGSKKNNKPYLGRAINWFKTTSSGRGTGAILRGVGAVAFGAAGLFVAVNSIGLAVLGIALCTSLIGIPLGVVCVAMAGAGLGLSGKLFQAAWSMGKKAGNDAEKAQQLATAEAK